MSLKSTTWVEEKQGLVEANGYVISRSAVPPIINQRRNNYSSRCLIDNGFTPFAESTTINLNLEAGHGTEIKKACNITFPRAEFLPPYGVPHPGFRVIIVYR
jgi:hypothetical protein